MVELHPDMPDPRPAERGFLEAFRKEADTAAIPPDDLHPVRPLRPEHIKRTAERVAASIAHQGQEAVRSFAVMQCSA